MSRVPLVLLSVLLGAAAALAGVAPATAGGPTSVLLASPTHQTAAGLYYADPRYAELEALLHGGDALVGEVTEEPLAAISVNATWLIHDVSIWRTDSLLLDDSGGAWVSTSLEWGDEDQVSSPSAWRELRHGERIRELVDSLGLLGNGTKPLTAPQETAEPPAVVPEAPPVVREETRWFSLTGWRWAVPGLLIGVLAAGLALRGREDGVPRQELVDRTPAPAR